MRKGALSSSPLQVTAFAAHHPYFLSKAGALLKIYTEIIE